MVCLLGLAEQWQSRDCAGNAHIVVIVGSVAANAHGEIDRVSGFQSNLVHKRERQVVAGDRPTEQRLR